MTSSLHRLLGRRILLLDEKLNVLHQVRVRRQKPAIKVRTDFHPVTRLGDLGIDQGLRETAGQIANRILTLAF